MTIDEENQSRRKGKFQFLKDAFLSSGSRRLRFFRWAWFGTLAILVILAAVLVVTTQRATSQGWTSVTVSLAEPSSYVIYPHHLALDRQGRIWVNGPGGLRVLAPDGSWSTPGGASSRYASTSNFIVDEQGRVWVAGSSNLSMLDPDGRWTTYAVQDNNVQALAIDGTGRVWVGGDGLNVLSPDGRWTDVSMANLGIARGFVWVIACDEQGRTWIGTASDGLIVVGADGGRVAYNTSNSGLADNNVRTVTFDGQGQAWVGTLAGLSMLSPDGHWTTYAEVPGLSHNMVRASFADEHGRFWVTNDAGLSVRDPDGHWTTYTASNSGLSSGGTAIESLVVDAHGRVWMGSGVGLITFDPSAQVSHALVEALVRAQWVILALLALLFVATGLWGIASYWKSHPVETIATTPKPMRGYFVLSFLLNIGALWIWFNQYQRALQGPGLQHSGDYSTPLYIGSLLLILALNLLASINQVRKHQRRAAAGILIGLISAPIGGIALALLAFVFLSML